jgi:hypothetical protein
MVRPLFILLRGRLAQPHLDPFFAWNSHSRPDDSADPYPKVHRRRRVAHSSGWLFEEWGSYSIGSIVARHCLDCRIPWLAQSFEMPNGGDGSAFALCGSRLQPRLKAQRRDWPSAPEVVIPNPVACQQRTAFCACRGGSIGLPGRRLIEPGRMRRPPRSTVICKTGFVVQVFRPEAFVRAWLNTLKLSSRTRSPAFAERRRGICFFAVPAPRCPMRNHWSGTDCAGP